MLRQGDLDVVVVEKMGWTEAPHSKLLGSGSRSAPAKPGFELGIRKVFAEFHKFGKQGDEDNTTHNDNILNDFFTISTVKDVVKFYN